MIPRLRATGRVCAAALSAALAAGCGGMPARAADARAADRGELALVETARVLGPCDRLAAAVARAGLAERLEARGPFTLLAPTDEAFLALPAAQRRLLEDPARLRAVLLRHVVAGEIRAPVLIERTELPTLHGDALRVAIIDRQVTIDGARVLSGDVTARNGVVHFVDRVLLPPAEDASR